jgi:hypothetical protein
MGVGAHPISGLPEIGTYVRKSGKPDLRARDTLRRFSSVVLMGIVPLISRSEINGALHHPTPRRHGSRRQRAAGANSE